MKGYVKKESIEYRYYKKPRKVKSNAIYRSYPTGRILIISGMGEGYIDVVCAIKTDYKNPKQLIDEVSEIKMPDSQFRLGCICIIPNTENLPLVQRIRYIVGKIFPGDGEVCVFLQKEHGNAIEYYVIARVPSGYERLFSRYYGELVKRSEIKNKGIRDLELEEQIRSWCRRTSFKQFLQVIEQRVKGQNNLHLVLVNVYQYLQSIANDKSVSKLSLILTGPSGCGKTETMRALKEYFDKEIPMLVVSLIDMNQLTSEGFKGNDTNYLVSGLKDGGSKGVGIVFLDEFDKRLTPAITISGDNVNSDIQHQILMTLEGYGIDGIDTTKTMFIGMGSFDVVREEREKRAESSGKFGFGLDSEQTIDHYDEITREEMIEMGACYELIGRFGQIVSYGALSYEAIDSIIDLRVKEVSDSCGIKISVTNEMRSFLHENSNSRFGNRLLESLIREIECKAMAEILINECETKEIIITGKDSYKLVEDSPRTRSA